MLHSNQVLYVAVQGQNVLTETLLRTQETPVTQRQVAESQGSQEQTDQAEPIPPASAPREEGQPYQRARVSSSDLEPFEVIEEDESGEERESEGRRGRERVHF